MRPVLPVYLVHSILLLASTHAESTSSTSSSSSSASVPLVTSERPITLWDVGFSLSDQWADLREPEECPVPPDGQVGNPTPVIESAPPTASTPAPTPAEPEAEAEPLPLPRPGFEPEPAHQPVAEPASESKGDSPDEPFVSFEEWKRLKLAEEEEEEEQGDGGVGAGDAATPDNVASSTGHSTTDALSSSSESNSTSRTKSTDQTEPGRSTSIVTTQAIEVSSVTFVPIAPSSSPPAHRYNYASPDCSARIHSSSPQTQHASSLLHKSRDRYMLTPCKANEHWVVVELCDEIRIDSIEVAVWEFFSGVVREVRVSVGGEEDPEDGSDDKGDNGRWTEVGAFIGKNVRGVQTFSLAQPTSFHRFVRLDFPSFYGSEYYCPVSQLKVYGMNQMDAFKWEQKRIKAGAKEKDKNREKEAEERRAKEVEAREKKEQDEKKRQQQREKELDELEQLLHAQADRLIGPEMLDVIESMSTVLDTPVMPTVTAGSQAETRPTLDTNSTTSSSSNATASTYTSTSDASPSSEPQATQAYTRSPPPRSDSSESIYAFIVRRLNALEGNSSLVSRYIEEQAKVMRHMLTRMEKNWDQWRAEWETEDRGRWEQERMRQEDRLGKVISQLEQQRMAIEHERKALQTQMRHLADELGYERRRGIAQMFITFTLVIIGVITRSSTIDAVLKPLLAEARRRRSIYGGRKSLSVSGPLTGLRIDMGEGRPPAIIGQGRPDHPHPDRHPENQSKYDRRDSLPSPTPTPRSLAQNTVTTTTATTGTPTRRRPGTPGTLRQRRPPSLYMPNVRSVSAVEGPFSLGLTSPRPRGSLPPRVLGPGVGAPRRLARSAHLHTLEADKVRDRARQDVRKHAKSVDLGDAHVPLLNDISPFTNGDGDGETVPDPLPVESDDGQPEGEGEGEGGWNTDQDTEASASEVDEAIDRRSKTENGSDSGVSNEVIAELSEIWKRS